MAITPILAMTAAEMQLSQTLPPKIAWMACHFSPYGTGLSNCPTQLPEGSLLILNDRTPIHGHDPEVIARQLEDCISRTGCHGLLLDFQRPDIKETALLVDALLQALPCPVAVSDIYGIDRRCPVFLPPASLHVALAEYTAPWEGRDIWLEIGQDRECITVTPEGSAITSLPREEPTEGGHADEKLLCHYQVALSEEQARFTLYRTAEDLDALLKAAERLGVTTAVGLYQEFRE